MTTPQATAPGTPISRRQLLQVIGTGALTHLLTPVTPVIGQTPLTLPPLPYAEDALAPVLSATTVTMHYNKHHRGYVDTLNRLLAGTPRAPLPLEEIIRQTAGIPADQMLFNNAAQAWNHTFYWHSLRPAGGGSPTGELAQRMRAAFGNFATFRDAFAHAAISQFGSGWGWLVVVDGKIQIVQTANAETPWTSGQTPLLAIDVWEHAYYLDYRNRRADYVYAVIDRLLNWEFAAANLARAG